METIKAILEVIRAFSGLGVELWAPPWDFMICNKGV